MTSFITSKCSQYCQLSTSLIVISYGLETTQDVEDQEQERSHASKCCSYAPGTFAGSISPTLHEFISITLYRSRQCKNLQTTPPKSTLQKEKISQAKRLAGKQRVLMAPKHSTPRKAVLEVLCVCAKRRSVRMKHGGENPPLF